MKIEVEIADSVIKNEPDVKKYTEYVRQLCLVSDFDLGQPIHVQVNHDRLSISYIQYRDDL